MLQQKKKYDMVLIILRYKKCKEGKDVKGMCMTHSFLPVQALIYTRLGILKKVIKHAYQELYNKS